MAEGRFKLSLFCSGETGRDSSQPLSNQAEPFHACHSIFSNLECLAVER